MQNKKRGYYSYKLFCLVPQFCEALKQLAKEAIVLRFILVICLKVVNTKKKAPYIVSIVL